MNVDSYIKTKKNNRYFNTYLVLGCLLWYLAPVFFIQIALGITLPIYFTSVFLFAFGVLLSGFFSSNFILSDKVKFSNSLILPLGYIIVIAIFLLQSIPISAILNGNIDFFYRNLIFEDTTTLFGSTVLYTLYNTILYPMLIFGLCILPLIEKGRRFLFWLFISALFFDAVVRFGRFPIFYAVFFLLYYRQNLNISARHMILTAFLVVIAMQYILFLRQYEMQSIGFGIEFFTSTFMESVFQYNLIGPLLFEHFASQQLVTISPLNFASLSALMVPIELILGRFGEVLWYPWKDQMVAISQPVYIDILQRDANAFGTNFLPIYLDLGFIGPFILGLFSGFILSIRASGKLASSIKSMVAFITFFGVYQSYIVMPYALFVFIPLMFGLLRIRRRRIVDEFRYS